MPTAISRIFTEEGFAIAADGRSCDGRNFSILSDSTQKIFGINRADRKLAYTICGTAAIGTKGQVLFSFESEVPKAIEQLIDSRAKSLWHFAVELTNGLLPSIVQAKEHRNAFPDNFPVIESSTTITIDGYYDGRAESARIEFRHHGIVERDTTESVSPEAQNDKHDCGSPQILGLLEAEADALSEFRPSRKRENMTLDEAIEVACNRVKAQCSAVAREISPMCKAIGGDIHIATVTPGQGVNWADGFSPRVLSYPIRGL